MVHKGECVANNTLFLASQLTGVENGLQCLMTDNRSITTMVAAQGKWLYPDGKAVRCVGVNGINSKETFTCSVSINLDGVTLYNERVYPDFSEVGTYSCCLPGHCDDNVSSLITARINSEFNYIHTLISSMI